jgi:predicted methyltransferase
MTMSLKKSLLAGLAVTVLAACGNANTDAVSDTEEAVKAEAMAQQMAANEAKLDVVLAAQEEANKARYDARNPKETLMFFGIEPGMTVVDVLPGGGWYTKILLPYIGSEGGVIGVDYSLDMWPEFGGFATPEFIENKKTWPTTWTESANEWRSEGDAPIVSAFAFSNRENALDGTADAVLFIRALHNLSRFESEGAYLTKALEDTHALLKPNGIVGVVQHEGPEDADEAWAVGNNGYLKKANVIAAFEAAGFELVAESDVNANPLDNPDPAAKDAVWRLPPTLGTSRDNPELRAEMQAIGETNRMTLKFVKK